MVTMKYAKKMKLVDIDDVSSQPAVHHHQTLLTDDKFASTCTLSTLDNSMNEILNRSDIDDGEKWILYNQILQRFLSYMKKTRLPNVPNTSTGKDQRNGTPEQFNGHLSAHDISGIFQIKDSLDTISQPNVRNFFEKARQRDINRLSPVGSTPTSEHSSQHDISPLAQGLLNRSLQSFDSHLLSPTQHTPASRSHPASPEFPVTPQEAMDWHETTRNVQMRRARKRHAQLDMSSVHPNKVAPRSLYRGRKPPPNKYDFIWQNTQAK